MKLMPNPNALYEDMETLNMLYEELMWDHDAELEFKADYENIRIIIQTKKEGWPPLFLYIIVLIRTWNHGTRS